MTTNILAKTLRAVNYCRVSSVGQTGERHSSLETQQSRFREHCQRHGLTPIQIFTDICSGRRDDRGEYRRMVEFVMGGGADVIVVQWLDRFGRNPREILRRYWELEERGVTITATDEDLREELQLLIRAFMAGAESRRTSERVRSNMGKAVAKGVHVGRPPYGLRPIRTIEAGKVVVEWELHPVEATVVREMYDLTVRENLGLRSIANRLGDLGRRGREGRPFAPYTILRILTNPAIKGTLAWGRKSRKENPQIELVEVPCFFPAILSEEEWSTLQARLAIRREHPRGRTHTSVYLLSGIARCGVCGGAMTGRTTRQGRFYMCAQNLKARVLCETSNIHSASKLEHAVVEVLGKYSDPQKVREMVEASLHDTESRTGVAARKRELAAVERRVRELEDTMLRDLDRLDRSILTEDEFRKVSEIRRDELSQLKPKAAELTMIVEEARGQAERVERVPAEVRSFLEDFSSLDIREQKARLQTILRAVYVWNDNRVEIEFR